MSKKDYVKFAEIIKERIEAWDETEQLQANVHVAGIRKDEVTYIARQMAYVFADDNPNFDRNRFLTACGITE